MLQLSSSVHLSSSTRSSPNSSNITLSILTHFREVLVKRNYTFDEMCYSVAIRICELGGNIRQSTVKNFYNKSSDCKASTVNEIGR
ncbi:hypothetical protein Glove_492g12 [Diversispora epigaea]|uniref:Uncharacterized protein n=1 Tax=Diversispora epigaea TaxID=1348612 RepID=A0A397GII0_9GLOM|nr:hypothetical protein Glove_492g12 [Diversispora epigaea]